MKTTQFHKDSRSMKFYETSSVTCCKHNIHRPKVRKGKGTKETKSLFISWVKQIKMSTVIIFRLTIPIPALTHCMRILIVANKYNFIYLPTQTKQINLKFPKNKNFIKMCTIHQTAHVRQLLVSNNRKCSTRCRKQNKSIY